MCWVNGGNERSFFTAAGDSFRVTSVLYLRACVREQLFEAKAAGIFLPCFTHVENSLSKVHRIISEGKSVFGCRGGGEAGYIVFRPYIFSVALGQHSPPRCALRALPRPLFSFAFLSAFVFPFAHQRSQLSRGIASVRAHFNCARHRAISR